MTTCCTPTREVIAAAPSLAEIEPSAVDAALREVVEVPGGEAFVGTAVPHLAIDGEGVVKKGRVKPFAIDTCAVTNQRFAKFVEETGYLTEAERLGDSFVFESFLPPDQPFERMAAAPWWCLAKGASWRKLAGDQVEPGVNEALWQPDHPVVQVSWNDARAFAKWAGGRLPTEMEWEHAARAGQGDVSFPWGTLEPDDRNNHPCNIWQGRFPVKDLGLDGYAGTAPVKSFEPNPLGLYNMVGNTWEWTADVFTPRSINKQAKAAHADKKGFKTMKGGSFLCHKSYCFRYRIAARTATSPDSATSHQGFRLVYSL